MMLSIYLSVCLSAVFEVRDVIGYMAALGSEGAYCINSNILQ